MASWRAFFAVAIGGCGSAPHPAAVEVAGATAVEATPSSSFPSGDRDGDRVSDGCDACPGDPETYNGLTDEDGCPDRPDDAFFHPEVLYSAPLATVVWADDGAALPALAVPGLAGAAATVSEPSAAIERVACVGRARADEPDALVLAGRRAHEVCARLAAIGVGGAELLEISRVGSERWPWDGPVIEDRAVRVLVLSAEGEELWRFHATTAEWVGPVLEPQENAPPPPGCTER